MSTCNIVVRTFGVARETKEHNWLLVFFDVIPAGLSIYFCGMTTILGGNVSSCGSYESYCEQRKKMVLHKRPTIPTRFLG